MDVCARGSGAKVGAMGDHHHNFYSPTCPYAGVPLGDVWEGLWNDDFDFYDSKLCTDYLLFWLF